MTLERGEIEKGAPHERGTERLGGEEKIIGTHERTHDDLLKELGQILHGGEGSITALVKKYEERVQRGEGDIRLFDQYLGIANVSIWMRHGDAPLSAEREATEEFGKNFVWAGREERVMEGVLIPPYPYPTWSEEGGVVSNMFAKRLAERGYLLEGFYPVDSIDSTGVHSPESSGFKDFYFEPPFDSRTMGVKEGGKRGQALVLLFSIGPSGSPLPEGIKKVMGEFGLCSVPFPVMAALAERAPAEPYTHTNIRGGGTQSFSNVICTLGGASGLEMDIKKGSPVFVRRPRITFVQLNKPAMLNQGRKTIERRLIVGAEHGNLPFSRGNLFAACVPLPDAMETGAERQREGESALDRVEKTVQDARATIQEMIGEVSIKLKTTGGEPRKGGEGEKEGFLLARLEAAERYINTTDLALEKVREGGVGTPEINLRFIENSLRALVSRSGEDIKTTLG